MNYAAISLRYVLHYALCFVVVCCALQGIPHELRGWVWWHISGAGEVAAADPGHYAACLQAGSSRAAVKQVKIGWLLSVGCSVQQLLGAAEARKVWTKTDSMACPASPRNAAAKTD